MASLPSARDRALVGFAWWAENNLPSAASNVLTLKNAQPKGLRNPVLRFVVPQAMNHVVEHAALRVFEAWLLLDAELESQQLPRLDRTSKSYLDLKRIRDKLVAHRIENFVHARDHIEWYKKTLGKYDLVLKLLQNTASEVAQRIRELQSANNLRSPNIPLREVPEFYDSDVQELLAAMKMASIY